MPHLQAIRLLARGNLARLASKLRCATCWTSSCLIDNVESDWETCDDCILATWTSAWGIGNRKLRNNIDQGHCQSRAASRALQRLPNIYGDCAIILTRGIVNPVLHCAQQKKFLYYSIERARVTNLGLYIIFAQDKLYCSGKTEKVRDHCDQGCERLG